jgi:MYXO-CTERM domain-containing protein
MRLSFAPIVAATAMLIVGTSAHAAIVAFDDFESYAPGQLESGAEGTPGTGLNGGNGWTGAYDVDDARKTEANVVNASLAYSNGAITLSGGTRALAITGTVDSNNLVSRPFAAQSASPIYLSFLLRSKAGTLTGQNLPGTEENFIQLGLSDAATLEPKVSVGQTSSTANSLPVHFFARGAAGAGGQSLSTTDGDPVDETTYLIVAKITKTDATNYRKVDFFLNPSTLTEPASPTLTSTSTQSLTSVNNFILRYFRGDAADQYLVDNLNVSTDFTSAVSTPEPASLGFGAVAAAGLLLRRRR